MPGLGPLPSPLLKFGRRTGYQGFFVESPYVGQVIPPRDALQAIPGCASARTEPGTVATVPSRQFWVARPQANMTPKTFALQYLREALAQDHQR